MSPQEEMEYTKDEYDDRPRAGWGDWVFLACAACGIGFVIFRMFF